MIEEDADEDEELPKKKKGLLERAQEKLELMEQRKDQGLMDHAIKDPKYQQKMK
jgi:hypothetical protein